MQAGDSVSTQTWFGMGFNPFGFLKCFKNSFFLAYLQNLIFFLAKITIAIVCNYSIRKSLLDSKDMTQLLAKRHLVLFEMS